VLPEHNLRDMTAIPGSFGTRHRSHNSSISGRRLVLTLPLNFLKRGPRLKYLWPFRTFPISLPQQHLIGFLARVNMVSLVLES